MAFLGDEYLITAGAVPLHTALGITDTGKMYCRQIIMRANSAATQNMFWGDSTLTATTNRAGMLRPSDTSPTILGGQDSHPLDIRTIYVIGTASATDILFVTLVQ